MSSKLKILFFTGAGISAESGLQTFRDAKDGLWNNYVIEDVCTPEGWLKNPELVLDFYNQRRKQCLEALPNKAHQIIAELEAIYNVTVVTQNVDNLHERAGSTNIIHLHGELMKSRSTKDETLIYPIIDDIKLGDICEKQSQLRPHIVWFGEQLEDTNINQAVKAAMECNLCVIIGSSLQVYPANQIPSYVHPKSKVVVIDPLDLEVDLDEDHSIHFMKCSAVNGMEEIYRVLKEMEI